MYTKLIDELNIEQENTDFKNKAIAFEKQVGFPYHDLQPRDFERLIYCIFKQEIYNNEILKERYDNIQLMQGVGERGRDCILLKAGSNVGVIQCKRYRNNMDKSEVGKEIIKFLLYYTQDINLITNLDLFVYNIIVTYGFSEKALDFINSLTDKTYNVTEIDDWAKGIINNTESLKSIVYDDVKAKIYEALDKITFEKMTPNDIDLLIEKYQEIKVLFFDFKVVIDSNHFEKLLIEREAEKAELLYNSSKLEILLQQKSEHLYLKLQDTKKVVQQLIDEYSANFFLYSNHTKKHSKNMSKILGDKLIDSTEASRLSETDLYILTTASYLHDIGVCMPNEAIHDIYNKYKNSNIIFNNLVLETYIRNNHPRLSYDYIVTNWKKLNLLSEWTEAIAMVAGINVNIDIFDYDYFAYDSDGGRTKVCIPYLSALIQLADMIDVENLNSNYLLSDYDDIDGYRFSRKLWDETNYCITCKAYENRLLFTGKCNDQLLYISLNRHIQEFRQKLETLNSKIQKYRPELKFSISFIEDNINSSFSEKIGFSMDHNRVAEMFIGDNIYDDKYIAIREVIQNSIDSCNLKRSMNPLYLPEIILELNGVELIVKDNGLGMNEYIIKNYFSALCRSYYKDNNLDSIGQFGIGVFSYFMLCNNFTVETKAEHSNPIKFKAFKNLKSYFYFYHNFISQINEGTITTLHLREDIINDLTFELLLSIVRDFFRFLDINIIIICGDKYQKLEKEKLILDIEKELIHKIKLEARGQLSDYKFLEAYINNNEYEGICGVIFMNTKLCEYFPFFVNGIFNGLYKPTILLCQKGVRIVHDNYWINNRIFSNNLVIKINFKKKLKININRNSFNDISLINIVYQFEKIILNKFFQSIEVLNPTIKCEILDEFTNHYLNLYHFPYKDFEELLLYNIHLLVYAKEHTGYMLISELIHNNDTFIFIGGEEIDPDIIKTSLPTNDLPIAYIKNNHLSMFCYNLFKSLKFELILSKYENGNIIINTKNRREYSSFINTDIPFDNKLLFSVVNTVYLKEVFYNSNHPFIRTLILNSKQIETNMQLKNKIHNFFGFIGNVYSNYSPTKISLVATNKYLNEVVSEFGDIIELTEFDFPEAYRKMIIQ